jgi:REP element-mobilizing transposase RayT
MPDTHLDVYLHFVWATKNRELNIPVSLEIDLFNIIQTEVRRLRCECLATNGMADPIHLLVRYGRSVSLGRLMNQVKGVSSAFLNERMFPNREGYFRWQSGYAVFSVSQNHVARVTEYIRNQKHHHATGKTWKRWEETPDEDGDSQNAVA